MATCGNCSDDGYENHDTLETSRRLVVEPDVRLSLPLVLCRHDEDWFDFEVCGSVVFQATVTITDDGSHPPLTVELRHSGNLTRVMVGSDGTAIINVSLAPERLELVYVRIYSPFDQVVGYRLDVDASFRPLLACAACTNDAFEPNNNAGQGTLLALNTSVTSLNTSQPSTSPSVSQTLRAAQCRRDEDWYNITVCGRGNITLSTTPLTPYSGLMPLQLELFAAHNTTGALATGQGNLTYLDDEVVERVLLLRVMANVVQYTHYNLSVSILTTDCNVVPVIVAQRLGSKSSESHDLGVLAGLAMLGGLMLLVSYLEVMLLCSPCGTGSFPASISPQPPKIPINRVFGGCSAPRVVFVL